jgi:cytidylate kinase
MSDLDKPLTAKEVNTVIRLFETEIQSLQAENDKLKSEAMDHQLSLDIIDSGVEKVAEIARLREALVKSRQHLLDKHGECPIWINQALAKGNDK